MNYIDYKEAITDLAEESISENRDSISVVRDNVDNIQALTAERISKANGEYNATVEGLTGIGLFGNIEKEKDAALVSIALDIDQQRKLLTIKKKLRKYDPLTDQIFLIHPGNLRGRKTPPIIEDMRDDLELIRIDLNRYDGKTHSYQYGENILYFDGFISPELLAHTIVKHRDEEIYIRLSPNRVNSQGKKLLREYIERPANPRALTNMSIQRGQKDSSKYFLDESSAPNHLTKKVSKLEVRISRNNSGNLSVLIEEIPFSDEEDEFIITRSIHCDTDAAPGTDINNAKLNHLDFSLNLYEGENKTNRLQTSLGDGPKVKSSKRLHFFRIENIPFKSLLEYARILLKSKTLTEEWINDQFKV